jgi:eukaryotic-like serine/threonine-protein kinase
MPSTNSAAAKLHALKLDDGWEVVRAIPRSAQSTGGQFSHSYEVRNGDGRRGFLKAFDFADAFDPGADTIAILRMLVNGYEHERDILLHCKQRGHSRISLPLYHGNVQVPGMSGAEGRVYFLILDMADGDIRSQVDASNRFNTLWSVRALRDVCLGLWHVHRDMIAHQDLKPSNVLVYSKSSDFRVADFGRASRRGTAALHDNLSFPGDRTYAPPEFMYGYADPDFVKRRIGCDLFMLGNVACFLFAGINLTANIMSHLAPQYQPGAWMGTYHQVLPYLQNAFTSSLGDLETVLDAEIRSDALRTIRELCNPDVSRRGHFRGIGRHNQYSLERYVSELDLLARRVEIAVRAKKAI